MLTRLLDVHDQALAQTVETHSTSLVSKVQDMLGEPTILAESLIELLQRADHQVQELRGVFDALISQSSESSTWLSMLMEEQRMRLQKELGLWQDFRNMRREFEADWNRTRKDLEQVSHGRQDRGVVWRAVAAASYLIGLPVLLPEQWMPARMNQTSLSPIYQLLRGDGAWHTIHPGELQAGPARHIRLRIDRPL